MIIDVGNGLTFNLAKESVNVFVATGKYGEKRGINTQDEHTSLQFLSFIFKLYFMISQTSRSTIDDFRDL